MHEEATIRRCKFCANSCSWFLLFNLAAEFKKVVFQNKICHPYYILIRYLRWISFMSLFRSAAKVADFFKESHESLWCSTSCLTYVFIEFNIFVYVLILQFSWNFEDIITTDLSAAKPLKAWHSSSQNCFVWNHLLHLRAVPKSRCLSKI